MTDSEFYSIEAEGAMSGEVISSALSNGALPDDLSCLELAIQPEPDSEYTTLRAETHNPKYTVKSSFEHHYELDSPHSVRVNWQKAGTSHVNGNIVPVGSGTDGDADERELKGISNGSNAATVLRTVAEYGDPMTSSMIESRVELDQSSVTPACHTLWERKFVERELTEEGTDRYEYQLTAYGRTCLSELEDQK